ncbi:UNVERIFIED_CONTAM: hypothetical protein RMT77_006427 [Armadillidium vulgare]
MKRLSSFIIFSFLTLFSRKCALSSDVTYSVHNNDLKLDKNFEEEEEYESFRKDKTLSFTPKILFLPFYSNFLLVSNNLDEFRNRHAPSEDLIRRRFLIVGRPYVIKSERPYDTKSELPYVTKFERPYGTKSESSNMNHYGTSQIFLRIANAFEWMANAFQLMSTEWKFNFREPVLTMLVSALERIVFLSEQVFAISPIKLVCGILNIALLPELDTSKIDFLLWTNENPDNYYKIIPFDKSSLDASNFDGNRSTKCMIHGILDNGTKPWIIAAKDEILASENANVISLNYSAYVSDPLAISISVCNVYRIAKYAAEVFNWIGENSALTGSRLHLIGHSLGAHIAGIIGYHLILLPFGIVIRISGLDPAGPLYSEFFTNENERLGRGQAVFVDVINSNGCPICLGLGESIGDANFYPNGGVFQPGCAIINPICSHERAPHLYAESIRRKDKIFKSWPCENYQKFKYGGCPPTCSTSGCQEMGYHVLTNLPGDFFFTTNAASLYAKGNDQN